MDKPIKLIGRLCWYFEAEKTSGTLVSITLLTERRKFKRLFWFFWWEVPYA